MKSLRKKVKWSCLPPHFHTTVLSECENDLKARLCWLLKMFNHLTSTSREANCQLLPHQSFELNRVELNIYRLTFMLSSDLSLLASLHLLMSAMCSWLSLALQLLKCIMTCWWHESCHLKQLILCRQWKCKLILRHNSRKT